MSGGHKKPSDPNLLPVDPFGPYPGYWTELMISHDWPPGWMPSDDWGRNEVATSQLATDNRNAQLELGRSGTIVGLSDRSDAMAAARRRN